MSARPGHLRTINYASIRKNYFDTVVQPAFAQVIETVPPVVENYLIAGKNVRLFFYSDLLRKKMSLALAHTKSEGGPAPDLSVHIWDSASTGIKINAAPWNKSEYFFPPDALAQAELGDTFLGAYLNGEETLNLYDIENKTAHFWTEDARNLPDWISAAPIRTILHWFLSRSAIHLVHGAVIGYAGTSIMLSAKGGSGKSTTALSCLFSGMQYCADDYAALSMTGKEITAYSLYNSIKIPPRSLKLFPELAGKIWNSKNVGTEDKSIVFLSEIFPEHISRSSTLVGLMIPVIKKTGETQIMPASKLDAMLALLPTTIFQLPLVRADALEELRTIIGNVPCYFLQLGPDIRSVPDTIKAFLAKMQ